MRVYFCATFSNANRVQGMLEHRLLNSSCTHRSEFKWSEGDLWTLELELPAGKHEYKLVIHEPAEDVAWWELGKNRELSVGSGSLGNVVNGDASYFGCDVAYQARARVARRMAAR